MAGVLAKWLTIMYAGFIHPFYVSMTEVNHNAKDKTLEISVRIFTDDFETALHNNYKTKVDLNNSANVAEMNKLVNDYIQKHLQLQVDGKQVGLSFIGYEQQSESTWTYFEVKNVAGVKNIAIVNSLLHDYRKEQINMLHLKANNKEESYKLDYPATQAAFSF